MSHPDVKSTKAEAKYTEHGPSDRLCQDCTMFLPPRSCSSVMAGPGERPGISRLGSCRFFKRKKSRPLLRANGD